MPPNSPPGRGALDMKRIVSFILSVSIFFTAALLTPGGANAAELKVTAGMGTATPPKGSGDGSDITTGNMLPTVRAFVAEDWTPGKKDMAISENWSPAFREMVMHMRFDFQINQELIELGADPSKKEELIQKSADLLFHYDFTKASEGYRDTMNLTNAGADMLACQKSSIIVVTSGIVNSKEYLSGYSDKENWAYKIPLFQNAPTLVAPRYNSQVGRMEDAAPKAIYIPLWARLPLMGKEVDNQISEDLRNRISFGNIHGVDSVSDEMRKTWNEMADTAGKTPALISAPNASNEIKILCSYQIVGEPEPDIETCTGEGCLPRIPDPEKHKNKCEDIRTDSKLWLLEALDEIAKLNTTDLAASLVGGTGALVEDVQGSNLYEILAKLVRTGIRGTRTIFRLRCNERYKIYSLTAPTSYWTRTSLVPIEGMKENPIIPSGMFGHLLSKQFSSAIPLLKNKQNNDNPIDGSMEGPQTLAFKGWWAAVTAASFIDEVAEIVAELDMSGTVRGALEGPKTATEFGKIATNNEDLSVKGEFSSGGYNLLKQKSDELRAAMDSDNDNFRHENNNFSSAADVPIQYRLLLSVGGVMNVEEMRQWGITRYILPYLELEVARCIPVDLPVIGDIGALFKACTPSFPYTSQILNQNLGAPNKHIPTNRGDLILRDQLKVRAEEAQLALQMDKVAGWGFAADAAQTVAEYGYTLVKGDVADKLERCVNGSYDRATYFGEDFTLSEFVNLWGGWGLEGLYNTAKNIFKKMQDLRYAARVSLLPCGEVLNEINPDANTFAAFMNFTGNSANFADIFKSRENGGRDYVRIKLFPDKKEGYRLIKQSGIITDETAGWFQLISVLCNVPGVQALVAESGGKLLTGRVNTPDIEYLSTFGYHRLGVTPKIVTDYTDKRTRMLPKNYMFARPGTPSSKIGFYDKECGFTCTSNPINATFLTALFGGQHIHPEWNLLHEQTIDKARYGSGAQMVLPGAVDRAMDGDFDHKKDTMNANIFNIFRDNEWRMVRTNIWWPTAAWGQVNNIKKDVYDIFKYDENYTDDPSRSPRENSIMAFVNMFERLMSYMGGSVPLAVIYDGSLPISTTITRSVKGTPDVDADSKDDFFQVEAVKKEMPSDGTDFDPSNYDGITERIFHKGLKKNCKLGWQTAWSMDMTSDEISGDGINCNQVYKTSGLVNALKVRSSWASEKDRPQVFNFKWQYNLLTPIALPEKVGFQRHEGNHDPDVPKAINNTAFITYVQGNCMALFSGNKSTRDYTAIMYGNTGSGQAPDEDNSGVNRLGANIEENLYINVLRAVSE